MRICLVAGARPNFIKLSSIIDSIHIAQNNKKSIDYVIVHTGQHYDKMMSDQFFSELNIPKPNINLNCGGGSQNNQVAKIIIAFEKYLLKNTFDLIVVFGDVNSTVACSLVAKKLLIKIAHVEAGLRSFDNTMPEEINRIITDSIADCFFTTSKFANKNLINTGVNKKDIYYVGNTIVDTLKKNIKNLKKPKIWNKLKLINKKYFVITLHRPSNVDDKKTLKALLTGVCSSLKNFSLIFPAHPRTKGVLKNLKIEINNLTIVDPMSYLEFNYLVKNSIAVFTDSGGITEETTFMGIPCMTLRDNTERPETISIGTNQLLGADPSKYKKIINDCFRNGWKKGKIPKLWDGKTGERIVKIFEKIYDDK